MDLPWGYGICSFNNSVLLSLFAFTTLSACLQNVTDLTEIVAKHSLISGDEMKYISSPYTWFLFIFFELPLQLLLKI